MNLRLKAAEIHIPGRVREEKFRLLFALTARSMDRPSPGLDGLSFADALRQFARFTADEAERLLAGDPSPAEAKKRLRDSAFGFGQELRHDLGIRSKAEVMRAGRLLYRLLGIDFRGSASGEIVIRKCFFADFYSPPTCGLMSALDEGILAGLAGGGKLEFSERITEKRPCCLASFRFPEGLR